jgi:hypothetical protein
MRDVIMRIAPCPEAAAATAIAASADGEIRAFLTGKTDGAALLHALYDEILDEPVPEGMLAIVRGAAG